METPPTRDNPAPRPPGPPGGQASPRLTLGPILLSPEQSLAPAMFLKALPLPLYHTVPPGGLQPRAALASSSLDGATLPFILSPLLQSEGPGPAQVVKPPAPVLTLSLVGALPLASPGPGPPLGSPGKGRSAGRYLCPHCARDCLKPSVLEKHIRSHTGERPFPCATCGIAFKTQSNLYKHRRTQTHLNNSRRSSEQDGAGPGLLDEGDGPGETPGADGSQGGHDGPGAAAPEAAAWAAATLPAAESPGAAGGPPARRKALEPRSPAAPKPRTLQRQHATSWEKAWEAKGSEVRLRKCESSDSGYLSRSDSAEQPPVPASPRPSLSEHGVEGQAGPGPGERAAALERLEERIARLISHNQAVVDDPQLDTVRPRKTVLSKQGSIDLPMPYTYKDSFHFDMRALEPGRRRHAALGSARSTCPPPDKARPLSFHSVPTQLSTTAECVSVTRSNSLPFVEGARMWRHPQEACPGRPRLLGPRPAGVLSAVPSTHPRALVRQAAVEDPSGTPAGESPVLVEDPQRTSAGEGAASRGRAAGRRGGQRKPKVFSQEKWQVYGDETFKRIYQKGKASPHGGKKAGEVRVDPPSQGESRQAGAVKTPVCGDTGTPVCKDERVPISGDMRTPIGGDMGAPVCGDVKTPLCSGGRIPVGGDVRTPVCREETICICGDMKTSVCGDVRISVCGDVRIPVCGDLKSPALGEVRIPVCEDIRTPIYGDTRTPICRNERIAVCGDTRTSVCGDVKTPVCKDIRTPIEGCVRAPLCGNIRTPLCGDILPPADVSCRADLGPWGGQVTPELSLVVEPPKARSGGSDDLGVSGTVVPPALSCRDALFLGVKSPQLPPDGRQEPGRELSSGPGPVQGGDVRGSKQEGISGSDGGESTHLWAWSTLGPPSSVLGQVTAVGDRLPSERKKLKVEGLRGRDQSEPPGAAGERGETLGDPTQATSPLALAQDTEPVEKPGECPPSAGCMGGGRGVPSESSGASWTSVAILRPTRPRDQELPSRPAAMPPGHHPQALDHAFTPKYLLRLPQEQTPSELSSAKGSRQDQDLFCRRGWPEEKAPSVGSGLGTPLSSDVVSGRTPEEADSTARDLDWSRSWGQVEGTQTGTEGENRVDMRPLVPQALASGTPTPTPGPCSGRNTELKTSTTRPLSLGSASRARPPGGAPSSWPATWEKTSEDLPLGPLTEPGLCCPSQPGSFLPAILQPSSWPLPALPARLRTPRSRVAEAPFPSLKAEPCLTWCCLSRSVPLPAEQKETSSVYASLHCRGGGTQDQGLEGWIGAIQRYPGPAQTSKLSCPIAPGVTPQSEPELKKGLPRRRTRTFRGISRQKKLRINPKRYRGAFLQSCAQLRASRLRKPHGALSGGCPPQPRERLGPGKGLQPASSETAGLNPHGESSGATLEPSHCCGNEEKKEDDGRGVSVTLAPSTSPGSVRETDVAVKDLSPSAGELGNCSSQLSPQSDPCLAAGEDHFLLRGKGLGGGSLESQLLLPTEHLSADPTLGIFADAQEPSSSDFKGTFPRHVFATSVAATGSSQGVRADHVTPGLPSVEPQGRSWGAEETRPRNPPGSKATAGGAFPSSLPEEQSCGQRMPAIAPLGSVEKAQLEMPASGQSHTNSHQDEGSHKVFSPSGGQHKCGDKVIPCCPLSHESEQGQVAGSPALKDCIGGPCNPGQPADVPEQPADVPEATSKTIKKRSLEGMRKQTRLEFSDSSSDDEDRLVIEI